jgi:hypothetical protein
VIVAVEIVLVTVEVVDAYTVVCRCVGALVTSISMVLSMVTVVSSWSSTSTIIGYSMMFKENCTTSPVNSASTQVSSVDRGFGTPAAAIPKDAAATSTSERRIFDGGGNERLGQKEWKGGKERTKA